LENGAGAPEVPAFLVRDHHMVNQRPSPTVWTIAALLAIALLVELSLWLYSWLYPIVRIYLWLWSQAS
jgi:hypothetical protein